MKLQQLSIGTAALCLTILLLAMNPARAYLDPGMGSYIFQIVIAAAVGAAFAAKLFFRRLLNFRKSRSKEEHNE